MAAAVAAALAARAVEARRRGGPNTEHGHGGLLVAALARRARADGVYSRQQRSRLRTRRARRALKRARGREPARGLRAQRDRLRRLRALPKKVFRTVAACWSLRLVALGLALNGDLREARGGYGCQGHRCNRCLRHRRRNT